MRAGAVFNATAVVVPAVARGGGHSAWHSPVPYLFGGLAAMLGLIAFALLILACSYWKLSGYLEGARDGAGADSDDREPDGKPAAAAVGPTSCYEDKVVVIMAGDEKPTYIATPMSSRASSFGEHSNKGEGDEENTKVEKECTGAGNETQIKLEQTHESQSANHNTDV